MSDMSGAPISATTAAEHGVPLLEGETGEWELVVGLEVHVELATNTKMWCGCSTDFGGDPNTNVCPVCTGQPGALPVPNEQAVADAALLGLALNGEITELSRFHRKNYFYPDLAKNYQISQYDVPLVHDGWLEVEVITADGPVDRKVRIERLHMEEDTGKSMHVGDTGRLHGADRSLIDYNRCGIPLLEIVSRPDIHDPDTAQAYLRELQGIVRATGVSDARMEEGSIRCDANVSVRRPGDELGTRCEIKNLNSVRSLGRAISYEAQRQIAVLEDGGTIVMETRHWDEGRGVTETLRRKESVTDYRYFPDPDLVEVYAPADWVDTQRARLPELPAAARARLRDAGVSPEQAATVVGTSLLGWYDERWPPAPTPSPSPTGSPARSRGSSRPLASTPRTAASAARTSPSSWRWSTTAPCPPSSRSRCSVASSRPVAPRARSRSLRTRGSNRSRTRASSEPSSRTWWPTTPARSKRSVAATTRPSVRSSGRS
jgi:aspartyl-tRNA(Asn)/glutamyl-tRNA(Gln) amidotransferase subunit B